MIVQQDNSFKEKFDNYLELVKYNEELKSKLDKTNQEVVRLKKQMEILSLGQINGRNHSNLQRTFTPQKGKEIVNIV